MSERERFEQFMRDHALDDKIHFARRDDGTYAYPGMSTLWQGWQARARIAEQEKRELVEAAYREGHVTGRCGVSPFYEDRDWSDSDARALLAKRQESHDE